MLQALVGRKKWRCDFLLHGAAPLAAYSTVSSTVDMAPDFDFCGRKPFWDAGYAGRLPRGLGGKGVFQSVSK